MTAHPLEWLKLKRQTIPDVDENVKKQEFSKLLLEVQNGSTTLRNSLAVATKGKLIHTL